MARTYRKSAKGKSSRSRQACRTTGIQKVAQAAYSMAKLAIPELHYLDFLLNEDTPDNHETSISDLGIYDHDDDTVTGRQSQTVRLVRIPQGDTEGSRTGEEVTLKALYGKVRLAMAPSKTGTANIRCMLVKDRYPAGGNVPKVNAVIEDNGATVAPINGLKNLDDSRRRYVILKDKMITLSADDVKAKVWSYYQPLKDRVGFDSNNKIRSGNDYFLMFLGDRNQDVYQKAYQCRVRFYP